MEWSCLGQRFSFPTLSFLKLWILRSRFPYFYRLPRLQCEIRRGFQENKTNLSDSAIIADTLETRYKVLPYNVFLGITYEMYGPFRAPMLQHRDKCCYNVTRYNVYSYITQPNSGPPKQFIIVFHTVIAYFDFLALQKN